MGTLRSRFDHTHLMVNEISLGQPLRDYDKNLVPIKNSQYRWDDSRLPNGEIMSDGQIIVDEMELI